ncbi:hypothetical protein F5146DRAFT_1013029 [Armillaria mellea]|nr:hypothetical protein F5146DRAFT_1013029 [Armillaria mellea]
MTSYAEETVHTFDNLLHSTDPPSSSEGCGLQDSTSAGVAFVVPIDSDVAALKKLQLASVGAEMEGLDGERGRAVSRVAEHKRLLSPVCRLPPEILYEIFLRIIIFPLPEAQPHRDRYSWDFRFGRNVLLSIALVCKTWHRAVLGFPELWSNINISLSDENLSSCYVRQLACQVIRARCRPLSIWICAGSDQASSKSLPPQLCVFLSSIQGRIQSLHLYLPAAMFTFVASLQLCLPILRQLALLSTNGEEFQKLSRTKLFGDTPLLNALDTVDIRNVVSALDLPCHQITHYSTYHFFHRYCNPGPATSDILDILSKSTNLEECDLRCELRSTQVEGSIPLFCPNLRTLTLSSWAYVYPRSVLAQLLDNLVIPHVSILKVDCCVDEGHERDTEKTFTAIRRIIGRSKSPLAVFHFTHGDIDEEDLLGFFRSVSSTLQEVRLIDVGPMALTDGILAPLVISDADNVLLPRLRILHISGEMQFDANLFVEMMESRWTCKLPSLQRLRTIKLCRVFDSNKDREVWEIGRALAWSKLEKYSTEGLELFYNILQRSETSSS